MSELNPTERELYDAAKLLGSDEIEQQVACVSGMCAHGLIHPIPGRRRWVKTLEALEAELLRLCGPVCPHDGKRASEHTLTQCADLGGIAYRLTDHQYWPAGEAWLRERSAK